MTSTRTRPLRIAVIGHVRHPVARPFMGGMEAHCWHLARALHRRGHEVTLFASGDSDAPGALHPVLARHYDGDLPWQDWHGTARLNALLDEAFAAALPALGSGQFDVIHNNSLHRYPPRLARRDGLAMVTSLHVPPFDALHRAVQASAAPWSRFTVCSASQRAAWWPDGAPPEAHVVPNGIDLAAWPFRAEAGRGAVWAGRLTPTKGAHLAVTAARIAGLPLTLFGAIENRAYFEAEIAPHLGGGIRHGGHLSQRGLAAAVGAARVFLFTPLWDEPFGLVAAEAMATGTPVAALPMGAVREVVGAAGGVVAQAVTAEALADAMREAQFRDRSAVHAHARARFGIDRMVDGYEALYAKAMAGRAAALPEAEFAPIELPPRPVVEAAE